MTGVGSAGGDHAMTTDTTFQAEPGAETELFLADWFDPLEAGVRMRIRSFIEELLEAELEAALSRKRYARRSSPENGADGEEARPPVLAHRHGHRERTLMGTFGAVTVCVPRARPVAQQPEARSVAPSVRSRADHEGCRRCYAWPRRRIFRWLRRTCEGWLSNARWAMRKARLGQPAKLRHSRSASNMHRQPRRSSSSSPCGGWKIFSTRCCTTISPRGEP